MKKRRIGILTGGGDVPGLNSVIKSVTYRGFENGCEIVGVRRGWEGLTHLDLDDPASRRRYVVDLDRDNTRTIDRSGGTVLHSTRTNPSRMKKLPAHLKDADLPSETGPKGTTWDLTPQVLRNLERLGLDFLLAIGGDDTLSYAAKLDGLGVKVIAIPKTMDNDVQHTEYCIGFSTAITRAIDAIDRQRTTVGSHERIGIFRIFGRDAGFTALYTSYVASTRCLIPEAPFDLEHLVEILVEDKRSNPSRYAVVIVAEGAMWRGGTLRDVGDVDMFGHRHKENVGEALADQIKRLSGEEAVASELTYDLRSGEPDMLDKMVAITYANIALDLIRDGVKGRMTAVLEGRYAHVALPDPALPPRTVDVATMYNEDRFRPQYSDRLGLPLLLRSDA